MKSTKPLSLIVLVLMVTNFNVSAQSTVTDIDGNVYTTVQIGTQLWLQQNLKATHYQNGDSSIEVEDSVTWANISNIGSPTPAWCLYGNSTQNDSLYGKLYNYYAVSDPRNVCPSGWHVPADSDVIHLLYIGESSVQRDSLKSSSALWVAPNNGETDSTGFSVLPGGLRNYNGSFSTVGSEAYFWSSTPAATTGADGFTFLNRNPAGLIAQYNHTYGFSCRCMKDSAVATNIQQPGNSGSIMVYPNPTNGLLNIRMYNDATLGTYIQVSDVLGREVYRDQVTMQQGNNLFTTNLQSLPAGMYILKLRSGYWEMTEKFVKE